MGANPNDPWIRSVSSLAALVFGDCFGASGGFVSRSGDRVLRPTPWGFTDDSVLASGLLVELLASESLTLFSAAYGMAEAWRDNADRGFSPATAGCLEQFLRGDHGCSAAQRLFNGAGSRGNGAAMRVAPVGAFCPPDESLVAEYAKLTSIPTHTNDEAVDGARVVALLANRFAHGGSDVVVFDRLRDHVVSESMASALRKAEQLADEEDLRRAVSVLGNGSRCLALDTVPLCAWIVHRCRTNIAEAYWLAVEADGDRDTCAAIVGGIIGATGQVDLKTLPESIGLPDSMNIRACCEIPESAGGLLHDFQHGR